MSQVTPPPSIHYVTVVGGAGSTVIQGAGSRCLGIGVKPPSAGSFDIDITDVDGFGIVGEPSCNGNTTIPCSSQMFGTNTIAISNASANGTYVVKVFYD